MQPSTLCEVRIDLAIPICIVPILDKSRQLRQFFWRKLVHCLFDLGETHSASLRGSLTTRNPVRGYALAMAL